MFDITRVEDALTIQRLEFEISELKRKCIRLKHEKTELEIQIEQLKSEFNKQKYQVKLSEIKL